MKLLVTGGAGFIGSAVIREALLQDFDSVINVDLLTYAGDLKSLEEIENNPRYNFERADICDTQSMTKIIRQYAPDYIMHLAAESHVDRSIDGPSAFINTNILGTYSLLQIAREYFGTLKGEKRNRFRFHHVSTDEVYGSLGKNDLFTESTPYQPNSPYSASKASSDHLVRAWNHTYNLPTIVTNCSNNYGPYQFPEKLIPVIILNGLESKPLPVYGEGTNVRDWLHVEDHARALLLCLKKGKIGDSYNIGGHNERSNLQVVQTICDILDEVEPLASKKSRRELISFVKDRPGHDFRYAINADKIHSELGWLPKESFETGIRKTVHWYLEQKNLWCRHILQKGFTGTRLGLGKDSEVTI